MTSNRRRAGIQGSGNIGIPHRFCFRPDFTISAVSTVETGKIVQERLILEMNLIFKVAFCGGVSDAHVLLWIGGRRRLGACPSPQISYPPPLHGKRTASMANYFWGRWALPEREKMYHSPRKQSMMLRCWAIPWSDLFSGLRSTRAFTQCPAGMKAWSCLN